MTEKQELSQAVLKYVLSAGACAAGIATNETLEGGPPSTDLSYVLPGAKSAVSFAVSMRQGVIKPYLRKQDRVSKEREDIRTKHEATGISVHLAQYLRDQGYESVPVLANEVYRKEALGDAFPTLFPDLSHRYLAVRSGVGSFGFSGNVITQKEGAAITLGSVVTKAELQPTDPIPPEDNYCDRCKLCIASCASQMMDDKEEERVSLGGIEFSYSKRRNVLRCELVCAGFAGLHPSGKWSTWSPARFAIPDDDAKFPAVMAETYVAFTKRRSPLEGGFYHQMLGNQKIFVTCGNCQLVCHPDRKERKRRYKMLRDSGVVIQNADGSLQAVSPEAAKAYLETMSEDQRALYEDVPPCALSSCSSSSA